MGKGASPLLLTDVDGVGAIRIEGGVIDAIGPDLRPRRSEETLDVAGGAVVSGLHDHHLHLFAAAATASSVRCGPPVVRDAEALATALRSAPPDGWLRGVGYHESVAGDLDRHALDRMVATRPLRIQHRSGSLWMLNTAGMKALGLRGDGRLFAADAELRARLAEDATLDLCALGTTLARVGVTAVTDATPGLSAADARRLTRELLQRVMAMGVDGPHKIRLEEHALPALGDLIEEIRAARAGGAAVAVHCVTRAQLVLTLTALEEVGAIPGDRIEHAAVAPPETVEWVCRLGLVVVTQPNFVAERGDDYLADVDPVDQPWLWRVRAFLDAGAPLLAGTDAPFGTLDPWAAMRAAVERVTPSGVVLGPDERVSPEQALSLFESAAVAVGGPADLCVLRVPWAEARADLGAELLSHTIINGALVETR